MVVNDRLAECDPPIGDAVLDSVLHVSESLIELLSETKGEREAAMAASEAARPSTAATARARAAEAEAKRHAAAQESLVIELCHQLVAQLEPSNE
jgi:hypothetical protein